MKDIKQQFSDFRTQTPKHVQWLLLVAAFVVVIILLTLLLTHKSHKNNTVLETNTDLQYAPTSIRFDDVLVGQADTEYVELSENPDIFIDGAEIGNKKEFKITTDCDKQLTQPCTVNVVYLPDVAQSKAKTELTITWHTANQEDTPKVKKIPVTYSARKKTEEPQPVQAVEQPAKIKANLQYNPTSVKFNNVLVGENDTEYIEISENPDIYIDGTEISETNGFVLETDCDGQLTQSCTITVTYTPEEEQSKGKAEIIVSWHTSQDKTIQEKTIPVSYSAKELIVTPMPQIKEPEPVVLPPTKCSEFAIPGYDPSGRQIGWIKPEHGANYFHPFSDKDCDKPTGKYDMNTGIITSLKDGSKIGTDSEHIGYRNVRNRNLKVPQLLSSSGSVTSAAIAKDGEFENADWADIDHDKTRAFDRTKKNNSEEKEYMTSNLEYVISSKPYDRTFILRQFKPIPATIVSEVRADPSVYGCNKAGQNCDPSKNYSIPVRATVDRNVYSDDGRTIILPTGTLLMGYLSGDLPGPYQSFGRMNIKWYQFIRPDGVEFNFKGDDQDPYSADAQGRMGVPGHGSTDYVEQMVMPILTALVPAAVNMIAPITDKVINQIDLDNNTIVQSGTIRSSEMAKQDIINTWNKITQKLLVDAIDNTVPPFSIAAGTRINVFSPVDLVVSCGDTETGKKCALGYSDNKPRKWSELKKVSFVDASDSSWKGQIRSFNLNGYCTTDKNGKITIDKNSDWAESGYDYRTVLAYCESQNYVAVNNAKNAAYSANVQKQADKKKEEYGVSQTWSKEDGWQTSFDSDEAEQKYNEEVLGLTYDANGNIVDPFAKPAYAVEDAGLTCDDGSTPDANGCCAGETYTDNGPLDPDDPTSPHQFVCCLGADGDCFPPITVE